MKNQQIIHFQPQKQTPKIKQKSFLYSQAKNQSSSFNRNLNFSSGFSCAIKYKYFNAFVLILSALCNAMVVVSFATINHEVTSYYGVSTQLVSFCALEFMIINPLVTVFANYILDNKGLKLGISINCFFVIVGVSLRMLISESFYFVIIGNALCAMGNIFIINCPARFSSVWFKPSERIIITSLLSFSNAVSGQIGAILSPYFVANNLSPQQGQKSIQNLIYFHAILISSVMLINLIFFRGIPSKKRNPLDQDFINSIKINPNDPLQKQSQPKSQGQISSVSSQQIITPLFPKKQKTQKQIRHQRYINQLKTLFKTKDYILILISFSFIAAVLNSFATNIELYILPFGFSSNDAGDLTMVSVVTGLLGAILSSLIIKKLKRFKIVVLCEIILSIIASVSIILSLLYNSVVLLYFSVGIFTMLLYPLFPAIGQYACQIMHPIRQSTIVGLLVGIAQLFSFGIVMVQTFILQQKTQKSSIICLSMNVLCFIIAYVSFSFSKQRLQRLHSQQNIPVK